MNARLAMIGAAGALFFCVTRSGFALEPPKVKAKEVPTAKERCLNTCDAKYRQCLIDGTPEENCNAEHEACREGCASAPPTPTP